MNSFKNILRRKPALCIQIVSTNSGISPRGTKSQERRIGNAAAFFKHGHVSDVLQCIARMYSLYTQALFYSVARAHFHCLFFVHLRRRRFCPSVHPLSIGLSTCSLLTCPRAHHCVVRVFTNAWFTISPLPCPCVHCYHVHMFTFTT